MEWANGNVSMQLPRSKDAFIKLLVNQGYAERNMHVLELAIALGLRADERADLKAYAEEPRDIAKVGQFDPDGVLAEVIMDRYGELDERLRVRRVMEHALWGIQRIEERFAEDEGLDLGRLLAGDAVLTRS